MQIMFLTFPVFKVYQGKHTTSPVIVFTHTSIFIAVFLPPALIDIILIFAPGAAKCGIGAAAQEYLLAVLAQPQGLLSIHQQEAEHHLDAQKQRMEVPIDGRLVQQLNMIAGRNAAEGRHTPAVQISCILVDQIIIVVVQNRCG